jgi:hypothetical protein
MQIKVSLRLVSQVSDTFKVSDTLNASLKEKLSKGKLKADKTTGEIELDGITSLTGVPKIAWEYKLGNRSALVGARPIQRKEALRRNHCRKIQHLSFCRL